MGSRTSLRAADGHQFGAYRAEPAGEPKGGVVVIQEIFGVNRHIRSVCDRVAQAGYVALAPQVFDRIERDFECGYSEEEVANARTYIARVDWDKLMLDTGAALDELKREQPTAILGFCMGGTVSFLAATKFDGLTAAVCYYGGQIAKYADRRPHCPVQMHFGELDTHIPMSDVQMIRQKRPESEVIVYPGAGHGFHCDERGSHEQNSARIAWDRTLAFFARHFGDAPRPMAAPTVKPPATPIAKQGGAGRSKTKKRAAKKARPKAKRKAAAKRAKRRSGAKRKPVRKAAKKARRKSRRR